MTISNPNVVECQGLNYEVDDQGYATGHILNEKGERHMYVQQAQGQRLRDPANYNNPPHPSWEFG